MTKKRRRHSKTTKPNTRVADLPSKKFYQDRAVSDWLGLATAILGPLLLYAITMPLSVVLEDDGLFIMAGYNLGISHPPGYPLYTIIVYLFTHLPFGNPALLGHLSSALLGALACGCIYISARLLSASWIPALSAALLFAASEHFWSQAIITEVYTLNALFFFSLYALILYGLRRPQNGKIWYLTAVVYGLSLANHWPLMGLATSGLLIAIIPVWRLVLPRLPSLAGLAALSAAMPYAWMVARSQQNPQISFSGAINSWDDFWWYLTRKAYSDVDANPTADWGDRLQYLQWFGEQMLWQLTIIGFVLAIIGLIVLFKNRKYSFLSSSLLVFLGNSILLIFMLSFEFNLLWVTVFRPYSLICYGLLALWLAVGGQFLIELLTKWLPNRLPNKFLLAQSLTAVLSLAMVGWSIQSHLPLNDRSDNSFAKDYAEAIFSVLPKDAILFVFNDIDTAILGYYQFVEKYRSDVSLYNLQGLIYGTHEEKKIYCRYTLSCLRLERVYSRLTLSIVWVMRETV